jgi:hypothetical protein
MNTGQGKGGHIVLMVHRALVPIKGHHKPTKKIQQGDVMISGDDQKRHGNPLEKLAGLIELLGSGPHGQIAGNHHGLGLKFEDMVLQPREAIRLKTGAKMQIGAMKDSGGVHGTVFKGIQFIGDWQPDSSGWDWSIADFPDGQWGVRERSGRPE